MCWNSIRSWVKLVRFHEYGPLALIACLSGALLSETVFDVRLLQLIAYTLFGSISAFVINDLADISADLAVGRFRNPLTTGELGVKEVLTFFTSTSALAIISLIGVNLHAFTLALITLTLSYLYSIGIRFKEFIPADLLIHGLVPALLTLTSYIVFRPLDVKALILSSMVFTASCIGGILQEIRDLSNVRSTVKYLGVRRSKDLTLILTTSTLVLYLLLTVTVYELNYLVVYTPLAYLILSPVIRFWKDELVVEELISKLRSRTTVIATLIVTTYLLLKLL